MLKLSRELQETLDAYNELTQYHEYVGRGRIAEALGVSRETSRYRINQLRKRGLIPEYGTIPNGGISPSSNSASPSFLPDYINAADIGFPGPDKDAQIVALKGEIEEMKRRQQWLSHSSSKEVKGGTLTINSSDYHYHDRGHLIETMINLEDKCVELITEFEPRRVIGIVNGDIIPGRGIYRNQGLENVLPKAEQQTAAAIFRFYEFDKKIKAVAPDREWLVLHGNHDYSMGDSTIPSFVWGCRAMGLPVKYVGYEWVQDVSDAGTHNILFEHGYGNSTFNPTSNKMIHETLKKVLGYANRGYSGDHAIRRVAHGHTHFLATGIERAEGVEFDTTGGMHRNDRANIGSNTRPCGWVAYISPPDSSFILEPIKLRPDIEVLRADMLNPDLEEYNRKEAARCLEGFTTAARGIGIIDDMKLQEPASSEKTEV